MLVLLKVARLAAAFAAAVIIAFAPAAHAAKVVNAAPVIWGTPATSATVGVAYRFAPSASDADGDRLTFSIANKPSWAAFDPATGVLSGVPATTGVHRKIKIAVSDGRRSSALAPFTITVEPAPVVAPPPVTGSAELTWTAPTQNEDGSALTNLAGYRIRYGTAPGELSQVVTIASPSIMSAEIEGLTAGTWYFSMTAYTNTGVESAQTGTVQKTVM